jgi:hypothetical protein
MTRRRDTALAFDAIRIEGGLFNPEYLAKVAHRDAPKHSDADYRVPKGLRLPDELGRYSRIAQALWNDFEDTRRRTDLDPLALVRAGFLLPLLRDVLGFTDIAACAPIQSRERGFPIGHQACGG